jgi:hypothetical protein
LLTLSSGDVIPQLPVKEMNQAGKYIMFMSLLENCIGKPVDLVIYLIEISLFEKHFRHAN